MLAPWKKSYDSILKSRDITLLTKVHLVQAMVFPVVMYGCESWTVKKALVLEKIVESPPDCKEIKSINPKGNQSWIFIGSTGAEAETPRLWPPDVKNWLIGKDPDAGKDWRRKKKGTKEDEMIGWHHGLWTWVWASSRSWCWTRKPGLLQSKGLQMVGHDWVTELNTPSPVFGMYIWTTVSTVGAISKTEPSESNVAVETIWTRHVNEPS